MDAVDLHFSVWKRVHAARERMPHALLFGGPAGNFKADFCLALAGSLLCESPVADGRACGQCLACNWFSQGNHPDFRWLRPESMDDGKAAEDATRPAKEGKSGREITIDQVRALTDFLNVGTHRAGARVVLITPAEAMNRNTANALLKSLEEPKPGTIFLLVSDHPDRLLPTIRSRCRNEPLPYPPRDAGIAYLDALGLADAGRWLALAGGAPRLALGVATGHQKRLLDLLNPYLERGPALDPIRLAMELDTLFKSEKTLGNHDVIEWTQRWTLDLMQSSFALAPRYHAHAEGALRRLAGQTEFSALSAFGRKAVEFKRLAHHPLNTRLFLEDFFSEYVLVFSAGSA